MRMINDIFPINNTHSIILLVINHVDDIVHSNNISTERSTSYLEASALTLKEPPLTLYIYIYIFFGYSKFYSKLYCKFIVNLIYRLEASASDLDGTTSHLESALIENRLVITIIISVHIYIYIYIYT